MEQPQSLGQILKANQKLKVPIQRGLKTKVLPSTKTQLTHLLRFLERKNFSEISS